MGNDNLGSGMSTNRKDDNSDDILDLSDSFYDKKVREILLEDELISQEEDGFMEGYEEDNFEESVESGEEWEDFEYEYGPENESYYKGGDDHVH